MFTCPSVLTNSRVDRPGGKSKDTVLHEAQSPPLAEPRDSAVRTPDPREYDLQSWWPGSEPCVRASANDVPRIVPAGPSQSGERPLL